MESGPDATNQLCLRSESLKVQLQRDFENKLPDTSIKIKDIDDFVVTGTPFRRPDGIEKLREFEYSGCIVIVEGGRQGKGYRKESTVTFRGMQDVSGLITYCAESRFGMIKEDSCSTFCFSNSLSPAAVDSQRWIARQLNG